MESDYKEKISNYTIDELIDVSTHIDKENFPDKYKIIIAELESRGNNPKGNNSEIINKKEDYKLYTLSSIWIASYLGGPIAGFYLISTNFKNLKKIIYAKKAMVVGIFTTLILCGVLPFIPEKFPNVLIPLVYSGIIVLFAKLLQEKEINTHFKNGNKRYSYWKVYGISFICLLITLICFSTIAILFSGNTLK